MLLSTQLADVSTASPSPLQYKSHKIKSPNKRAMITALQKQRGKMIITDWTCLTTMVTNICTGKYQWGFLRSQHQMHTPTSTLHSREIKYQVTADILNRGCIELSLRAEIRLLKEDCSRGCMLQPCRHHQVRSCYLARQTSNTSLVSSLGCNQCRSQIPGILTRWEDIAPSQIF